MGTNFIYNHIQPQWWRTRDRLSNDLQHRKCNNTFGCNQDGLHICRVDTKCNSWKLDDGHSLCKWYCSCRKIWKCDTQRYLDSKQLCTHIYDKWRRRNHSSNKSIRHKIYRSKLANSNQSGLYICWLVQRFDAYWRRFNNKHHIQQQFGNIRHNWHCFDSSKNLCKVDGKHIYSHI